MIHEQKHPMHDIDEKYKLATNPEKLQICTEWNTKPHRIDTGIEKLLHERAARIEDELLDAFHAIKSYPKSVTFFGSARLPETNPYYQQAKRLAGRICKEGFAVITGGGPGIMQAGNAGSYDSCSNGVGFNIELPHEQVINPYVTHGVNFHYFFTRKVGLFFSAEAYLYFPGGFGTLDEFFELVTLVQTKKLPAVPIILVGSEYWTPIMHLLKAQLLDKFGTVSPEDFDLFKILDDEDEILDIIIKAPLRNEYD